MKCLRSFFPFVFCVALLFISGCTSSEIGESKDVSQETIFQQYSIRYSEGDENATVYSQFRFAGDDGTTLVLTKPGGIRFDGISLAVDSSDYEGAFYKKSISESDFYGDHIFVYTDINNKRLENRFSIEKFKLVDIPEVTPRTRPLQIPFESSPLGPNDYLEINTIDTDSSFTINHTPKENKLYIIIPVEELQRQKHNQLKLVATLHRKIALQQNTTEGGKLEVEHTLKPIIIKLEQ